MKNQNSPFGWNNLNLDVEIKLKKSTIRKEMFLETIKFCFLFIAFLFKTYVINNKAYLIALLIPVGLFIYYFIQWIAAHQNVFFSTL